MLITFCSRTLLQERGKPVYQLQTSSRQRIRTQAVVCSSHVRQRSFRVFPKRLPFTMLVYSWFCGIFYLITSLLWKNEYLKWNFWHSIVFCLMYFVTICLVCINQNILESKVISDTNQVHVFIVYTLEVVHKVVLGYCQRSLYILYNSNSVWCPTNSVS